MNCGSRIFLTGFAVACTLVACSPPSSQDAIVGPSASVASDPGVSKQKEKPDMDDAPTPSRPAPPVVPPVEYKGVKDQQDMQAFRFGGTQRGGYLVAIDPKTSDRLWMLKVYPVTDHSAAGVESPGIYF